MNLRGEHQADARKRVSRVHQAATLKFTIMPWVSCSRLWH
jgi:hypothetical protein